MNTLSDFRERARQRLPRFVFDYIDGAAEDERCMARNRADFDEWMLIPRQLRDTSTMNLGVEVFGQSWNAPLGIAPMGFCGLVRPEGDLLLARAAAARGLPFLLSSASNTRLECIREALPVAELWLQLYVMQDRRIAEQLMRRAQAARFGALVLTVDVPVSGLRERDLRNGFSLPFRPGLRTVLDLLCRPAWCRDMARHGGPTFANLSESADKDASAQTQAAMLSTAMDRTLNWDNLAWIRDHWQGPLLIKGLLHPEDAARARAVGADGIIVSNHGGRQLDAAPSAIRMLPEVVAAVGRDFPVFLDSGIRRGSDVAKALALGAHAVFVGRPALWGLAAEGEPGVRAVLDILIGELERTLILLGEPQAFALTEAVLFPR